MGRDPNQRERKKGRFEGELFLLHDPSILIQFVRRTANTMADKLASNGLQGVGTRTWESRPPDWLWDSLDRDLS